MKKKSPQNLPFANIIGLKYYFGQHKIFKDVFNANNLMDSQNIV